MLFRLYIGSNNTTKKLETEKAKTVINRFFEGYTITKANGLWKGETEKSLVVDIETNNKMAIKLLAKRLCLELQQQVVGVAKIGKMSFVS